MFSKACGKAVTRIPKDFDSTRPTLAVARYSQAIVNLPKYAVHGRGATKPTAPVSLLA